MLATPRVPVTDVEPIEGVPDPKALDLVPYDHVRWGAEREAAQQPEREQHHLLHRRSHLSSSCSGTIPAALPAAPYHATRVPALFRGSGATVFGVMNNELHRLLPKDGGYVMEGASLTNIEVLAMLALSDGRILMGTSKAFYRSDDGGSTWKEIGLP